MEQQLTYISATFLFTSNTHFQDHHAHFYGTFAFSNAFLTNQAQRMLSVLELSVNYLAIDERFHKESLNFGVCNFIL